MVARLELPDYRGRYPMRTLQRHVPGFYHRLRESGNRRVNPIDYVRHSFQNYTDEPLVNLAMNWIFLHAETHELPQCLLYPKSVSIHENPIKVTMANIDEALEIDDIPSALYFLDLSLCIVHAVSEIIRNHQFGASPQMLREYYDSTLLLVPLISSLVPLISWFGNGMEVSESLYALTRSVAMASGGDVGVVERLLRQLGIDEMEELRQYCYLMAQTGDIFSANILRLIER